MKISSLNMKRFCNENYFIVSVHVSLSHRDPLIDNAEIFTLAFSVAIEKMNEELSFPFSYNRATRKHQIK